MLRSSIVESAQTKCPSCGERGRTVKDTTIACLVAVAQRADLGAEPRFCASGACDVVYFGVGGAIVTKTAMSVRVFQKETAPDRPVCYCFEHSARAIVSAQRVDGSNTLFDAIKAACKQGRDRCAETNPQGRCCLANVRAVGRGLAVATTTGCSSCGSE